MIQLEAHPKGVLLPVRAHAGARRNALEGVREGMLRASVTAAPEKGKANKAIVDLLSKALGLPKSSIELVAGETSTRKTFLVTGAEIEELKSKLTAIADS